MKTIQHVIARGQQDYSLLSVFSINNLRLRVQIKSDAYDFQSYARIDMFHKGEGKWERVADIPFAAMHTKSGLHYLPKPPTDSDFDADRLELIRLAKEILGLRTE